MATMPIYSILFYPITLEGRWGTTDGHYMVKTIQMTSSQEPPGILG